MVYEAQGHRRSPIVSAGGRQIRAQKKRVSSQVGLYLSSLQPKAITWQEGQNHNVTVAVTFLMCLQEETHECVTGGKSPIDWRLTCWGAGALASQLDPAGMTGGVSNET